MRDDGLYPVQDSLFTRGDVPMTKEEVRALVCAKMRIQPGMTVIDIGAGTGALSIDFSRASCTGTVYAVEKNQAACALIRENAVQLSAKNISLVQGEAPEAARNIPHADRIFIGGNAGRLSDILQWADAACTVGDRIVLTAVTLETLTKSTEFFSKKQYERELLLVSCARVEDLGSSSLFRGQNPVWIIAAEKIHA